MKVNGQLCVQQGISKKEPECCLETGSGIVHSLPVVIIRLYIIYRHTHTKYVLQVMGKDYNTITALWEPITGRDEIQFLS